MAKHGSKQRFSSRWATMTELGEYFGITAREIGQKLVELELRMYNAEKSRYIPTQEAVAEGLCTYTELKSGLSFYLWHREKVSALLQEKTQMNPASVKDIEYRRTALDLLELAKGEDKLYYLFLDAISAQDLPPILAWALIEARKDALSKTYYQDFLDSIEAEDFLAINQHLTRLGVDIRLGEREETFAPRKQEAR